MPVKVMSERLGHSTSSFTADAYQHVTPALEEQAASNDRPAHDLPAPP